MCPDNIRTLIFILFYFFYLFIYLFIIGPTCANTSERSAGSRVRYLGPFSGFKLPSDRPFVIERQVCSLSTKPQVSTTLHYTITVCCNRTAHSQHCQSVSVEARELNLKYARATGELNPGTFALAGECNCYLKLNLNLNLFIYLCILSIKYIIGIGTRLTCICRYSLALGRLLCMYKYINVK